MKPIAKKEFLGAKGGFIKGQGQYLWAERAVCPRIKRSGPLNTFKLGGG